MKLRNNKQTNLINLSSEIKFFMRNFHFKWFEQIWENFRTDKDTYLNQFNRFVAGDSCCTLSVSYELLSLPTTPCYKILDDNAGFHSYDNCINVQWLFQSFKNNFPVIVAETSAIVDRDSASDSCNNFLKTKTH